jgi:hypothetical protein
MNITGLNFQPDLAWIKSRSAATDHALYDATRGVQKRLESNNTDAEATSDNGVTSFNSDGVTLGTLAQVNTNAATYALWAMKQAALCGFEIVIGTQGGGNTNYNHSLGVKPAMLIVKNRTTGSTNWLLTHKSLGTNMQDYILYLNATNAASNSAGIWGGEPTTTQFSIGSTMMAGGASIIAYLWAEVAGFSAFGKYTGNGGADGPFVWCGFRPAWIMIKRSDSTSDWLILDAKRVGYNVITQDVYVNLASAEATAAASDFVSNGFKLRSSTVHNVSSATYVYAAFSESPFKYARGR